MTYVAGEGETRHSMASCDGDDGSGHFFVVAQVISLGRKCLLEDAFRSPTQMHPRGRFAQNFLVEKER